MFIFHPTFLFACLPVDFWLGVLWLSDFCLSPDLSHSVPFTFPELVSYCSGCDKIICNVKFLVYMCFFPLFPYESITADTFRNENDTAKCVLKDTARKRKNEEKNTTNWALGLRSRTSPMRCVPYPNYLFDMLPQRPFLDLTIFIKPTNINTIFDGEHEKSEYTASKWVESEKIHMRKIWQFDVQ